MDIVDLDPSTFPRDDFGPPLGGMPTAQKTPKAKTTAIKKIEEVLISR